MAYGYVNMSTVPFTHVGRGNNKVNTEYIVLHSILHLSIVVWMESIRGDRTQSTWSDLLGTYGEFIPKNLYIAPSAFALTLSEVMR